MLQIICQFLQVVGQIVGISNLFKELSFLILNDILEFGTRGLLSVKLFPSISVLLYLNLNNC